jgi:hypothetical protein
MREGRLLTSADQHGWPITRPSTYRVARHWRVARSNRNEIANKVQRRPPVLISAQAVGSGSATATLTVGKSVEARWNVLQTVGSERQLLWNVEASKSSLARRLEELAAWYLHVS